MSNRELTIKWARLKSGTQLTNQRGCPHANDTTTPLLGFEGALLFRHETLVTISKVSNSFQKSNIFNEPTKQVQYTISTHANIHTTLILSPCFHFNPSIHPPFFKSSNLSILPPLSSPARLITRNSQTPKNNATLEGPEVSDKKTLFPDLPHVFPHAPDPVVFPCMRMWYVKRERKREKS